MPRAVTFTVGAGDVLDDRTARFEASLLDRDPSRHGTGWAVLACDCGCGCRRYIPVP